MLHLTISAEIVSDGFYCITKIFWKICPIPHKDLKAPEKLNGMQEQKTVF